MDVTSEEIKVNFVDCSPGNLYYKYIEWPTCSELTSIIRLEDFEDFSVFTVEEDKTRYKTLKIVYKPVLAGTSNFEYFIITAEEQRKTLYLKGNTVDIHVSSPSSKIYLLSDDGRPVKQTIEILNESLVDTLFQFDINNENSEITLSPSQGALKKNESIKINVIFSPKQSGFIYRKIFCLIRWQAPITFIVHGNCKKYSQVQEFTDYIYTNDTLPTYCDSYEEYIQDVALMIYPESKPLMTFNKKYIDFGYVDMLKGVRNAIEVFTITNHGLMSYVLLWKTGSSKHFRVEPQKIDITSNSTQMFKVIFKPTEPDQMYSAELHAEAKWGQDAQFVLPFPLSINTLGHTFLNERSGWDPFFNIDSNRIILPATIPNHPTNGTFTLFNKMQHPLMFQFIPPDNTLFTVKPLQGIIKDNFQMFIIRLFPDVIAHKTYSEDWKLEINAHTTVKLTMLATAELPCLEFSENRLVKFPSTNIHSEKCLPVFVKNTTRLEIRFSIVSTEKDCPFSCENYENIIGPREQLFVDVYFKPKSLGEIKSSLYLETAISKPIKCDVTNKSVIMMEGICNEVSIVVKEKIINLGTVLLHNWAYGSFLVCNDSECDAFVQVKCDLSSEKANKSFKYKICPELFALKANSGKEINVGVCFEEDGPKQVMVIYSLYTNESFSKIIDEIHPSKGLLRIDLFCSLPTLQVADIRLNNIGRNFSKSHLWQMLEINSLNTALQNFDRGIHNLNMKLPSFGENTKGLFIELLVQNISHHGIKLDIFPEKICDCKFKVEDRGISTRVLIKHCKHDSQVTISNKKTIFLDKEEGIVEIHCDYTSCDRHLFKYVLSLSSTDDPKIKGLINIFMERHCFKKDTGWLDFFTCTLDNRVNVDLEPVFVGDPCKPVQLIWVYNNSGEEVLYKIKSLNINKYRENIFHFLNTTGTVASQELHPIMLKFKPYQFITYTEEVTITTSQRVFQLIIKAEGKSYPCYNTYSMLNKVCPTSLFDNWSGVQTSFDIIALSPTLLHSTVKKIVFLKNHSTSQVKFYWVKRRFGALLDVKVIPVTGILEPGETIVCQMLIVTLCSSARFHANITCKFTDIQERDEYISQVDQYRKEARLFDACFEFANSNAFMPVVPNVTNIVKPLIYFVNITICIHTINENQLDMVLPRLETQILSLNQPETLPTPKNLKLNFYEGNVIVDVFSKVVWEVLHKQIFLNGISYSKNNHYYRDILRTETETPIIRPSNQLFTNIIDGISCNVLSEMLGLNGKWQEEIYHRQQEKTPRRQELRKLSNKYYSDILDQGVYQITSLYSDRNMLHERRYSDLSKRTPKFSFYDV